jgi:dipeptidyl aminopeptidase/acylaminoacyl peptidase
MATEDAGKQYTFEQFAAVRRYGFSLDLSPDGSEVVYIANISGQYNLWKQPIDGGYPLQLTFYTEQAVRQVAWSPDGQTLLYAADRHGNEFYQLYAIPAKGGEPNQLTDAPRVQHIIAQYPWSPDGRSIAYLGNDRVPTDQDLLVQEMVTGEVRRVLYDGGLYHPVAWSPNGMSFTAVDIRSRTNTDIFLVSATDGSSRKLTEHSGEAMYIAGPWATDGSGFYLLTNGGREFLGLAFQAVSTNERAWVETPDWDIERHILPMFGILLVSDGRYLAWVVNEDGYSRLRIRDLHTGEMVPYDALPGGQILAMRMSRSGGKLALQLSTPGQAMEVFTVDIASGRTTQITYGMLGGIDPEDMVKPELIRYPTHDGKQIPAFLYRPKRDGPFPVVLSIHGGPEAQERPIYAYLGLYQYLLNRGIGVLAPNVRGSTGYGLSYQMLIHHDWGGDELKDFEAAVKYLHTLDWVDKKRIAVFGASFGGFAALSCVSRLPDYWAAGVDLFGPSNLVTFAKTVPPIWKRFVAQMVGDPETDADFLMSRSPVSYVDRIKTPLYVMQGANDPRVVKAESDQIVEKLRERGVDVKYDVFEDEGHGFTKRENELKALGNVARFLEAQLLA